MWKEGSDYQYIISSYRVNTDFGKCAYRSGIYAWNCIDAWIVITAWILPRQRNVVFTGNRAVCTAGNAVYI